MNLANNKISLLVESQLPEFIQEEYPQFVRFIEAYYEFLENKQTGQQNDLYTKAKEFIDITDIDQTLNEFEDQFFNTYLQLFPTTANTEVSKQILIKNSIPFYLSKGNEKSFKYFFKSLFDEDVEIQIPKNNVLIASGGKWLSLKTLRAEKNDVVAYYTANTSEYNGQVSNTVFYLPQELYSSNVRVFSDGVQLQPSSFYIQKEYKKIVLNNPINSLLEIYIQDFNPNLLVNRKITGSISGASAIIEKVFSYKNSGVDIFEFEVNDKTIRGSFLNGESFLVDILNEDESLLKLKLKAFSSLKKINIVDGGSRYNVGDQVVITGGAPSSPAIAYVSSIYSGVIDKMNVTYGGAGFQTGSLIQSFGIGTKVITGSTVTIDTSGTYSKNSHTINTDLIWDLYSSAISLANYRSNLCFSSSTTPTINANTRLIDAFSYTTISGIGPISTVYLLTSNATTNLNPVFDAFAANVTVNSTQSAISPKISVLSDGAIGRVDIFSGGTGYQVGDKLDFAVPPGGTGFGARGAVTSVDSSGTIKSVQIQPYPPSANSYDVSITAGNVIISGANTSFNVDFRVSSSVMVFNQERTIESIQSNTSMRVTVPFDTSKSNTEIGLFNSVPLGGQSYTMQYLPIVTVNSSTGIGATISASSIMGDGEILSASGLHPDGEIQAIEIYDDGSQFRIPPEIDLSTKGSGTAQAQAEINYSYYEYPGKYTTTDGFLSGDKKIQDSKLYNTGTYILKTKQQFAKFKTALLNLLHPSGSFGYCYYTPSEPIIFHKFGGVSLSSVTSKVATIEPLLNLDFAYSKTLNTFPTESTTSYVRYKSNNSSTNSIINFSRVGNAYYINSRGYYVAAATNVPRFDYDSVSTFSPSIKGLLIEGSRTNYIRNNTMQGSVPGTPGTTPTNWSIVAPGLTTSISGVGQYKGINYIDLLFTGTSSSTNASVYFDTSSGISAVNNQTWSSSLWIELLSGSFANVTSVIPTIMVFDGSALVLSTINGADYRSRINSTELKKIDSPLSITGVASAAYARPLLRFNWTSSNTVNFAVRIGLPQLEIGPKATSTIPTSTIAVTRNLETATINTSYSWFNSSEGILFAEYVSPSVGTSNSATVVALRPTGDTSNNSTIEIIARESSTGFLVNSSGTISASFESSGVSNGSIVKAALGFKSNDFSAANNGILVGADATLPGGLPTSIDKLRLGYNNTTDQFNGWIRKIGVFNYKLSNSVIQNVTS